MFSSICAAAIWWFSQWNSSNINVFFYLRYSRNSKVQHARRIKHLGNDAKRGHAREGGMWRRGWALCVCVRMLVCVPGWLTSELRLCMLWRAGHPVELFLARPEECKAATSTLLACLSEAMGWHAAIEMWEWVRDSGGGTGRTNVIGTSSSLSHLKREERRSVWDLNPSED